MRIFSSSISSPTLLTMKRRTVKSECFEYLGYFPGFSLAVLLGRITVPSRVPYSIFNNTRSLAHQPPKNDLNPRKTQIRRIRKRWTRRRVVVINMWLTQDNRSMTDESQKPLFHTDGDSSRSNMAGTVVLRASCLSLTLSMEN